MNDQIKVTGYSEVNTAVRSVEEFIKNMPDITQIHACPLICEELLQRLLYLGCTDISVSFKGFFKKYIEITAKGERADIFIASGKTDTDKIGFQISDCLLNQYADHFTFQYKNSINIYRVYVIKENTTDLADEIYAYYENPDTQTPGKPMSVLWHIMHLHRGFFTISVIIHLLKHLAALMLPVFVSNIINIVTDTGQFFVWSVMINILMSVIALIVNLSCYWLDSRYYRRFTRAVEAGLKMALVQKLQMLSMRFHNASQSGVILSKLVSDVQYIQMLIYDRFMDIMYLCEDVVFIIVIALTKFPLMLVFYVIIVPAVAFLLRRFSGPLNDSRARMRKQNEQANAAIKEMLEMEGLTRAHGLDKTEYMNILSKVRDAQRASIVYDKKTVGVNNITFGGFQGLRLLSLSFAALLTAGGYINVGTLVLFQSIFDLIINNVQRLLDSVPLITQGYDSLVSINEILYEKDIDHKGTELLPNPVRGEIEFKNVTFGYDSGKDPILKDISFHVPSGGSTAFIGQSGEGKSTILNLILGLYRPQSGEILIDGKNINSLEPAAYRRNISVVPQNTVLFSGTLWDNLVYGLRYVSTDTVMEVIDCVGLNDLLNSLPDGLSTQIFENGSNLSGGQRQRISIARALLRNPKIILLDEATSALDSENEKKIQETIDSIMGSCTVIMVAHRMGTLRKVDTVYRLTEGRLEAGEI